MKVVICGEKVWVGKAPFRETSLLENLKELYRHFFVVDDSHTILVESLPIYFD
jgi:hypothetical protein